MAPGTIEIILRVGIRYNNRASLHIIPRPLGPPCTGRAVCATSFPSMESLFDDVQFVYIHCALSTNPQPELSSGNIPHQISIDSGTRCEGGLLGAANRWGGLEEGESNGNVFRARQAYLCTRTKASSSAVSGDPRKAPKIYRTADESRREKVFKDKNKDSCCYKERSLTTRSRRLPNNDGDPARTLHTRKRGLSHIPYQQRKEGNLVAPIYNKTPPTRKLDHTRRFPSETTIFVFCTQLQQRSSYTG